MKNLLLVIAAVLMLVSCGEKKVEEYDFEALKDSLHIDKKEFYSIKEVSPDYSDNNPYRLNSEERVKTLFWTINKDTKDTIIYAVLRDNSFVFWGKGDSASSAKELIEWTINNREKI